LLLGNQVSNSHFFLYLVIRIQFSYPITMTKQIFSHKLIYLLVSLLYFTCDQHTFAQKNNAVKELNIPALTGTVLDQSTGEPILGATITLDYKKSGFITDSLGHFLLYLPVGEYILKVSHVGYKSFREKVTLTKDTDLKISLEDVTKTLEEVIVSSQATRRSIETPSLGVTILSIKGIKKLPAMMGEVDIIRSLQTLPGVSSVGEGSNGVNIRGGNIDQNLIYIDDMPIFNPTHLFGLFSVFASDAIREMELYKGGVPARFGGRSAAVLDIKMTEPKLDTFRLSGGVGLVSNRVMAEVPIIKDKLSIMAAGRVSFNDFLFKWFAPKNMENTRANFYDIATKVFYRPNKKNTLTFATYFSKDYYQIDSLFSLQNVIAKKTQFDYGHQNMSIHWSRYFNPKLSMEVVGVTSDYKTTTYAPDTVNRIDLKNQISYKNLKIGFDYSPNDAHKLNFGLSGIRYDIQPGTLNKGIVSRITSVELPNEQALELAAFVDDEYKVNARFTVQAGLRYALFMDLGPYTVRNYLTTQPKSAASVFSTEEIASGAIGQTYSGFEPRVTMKYTLSENSTIKFGYNRMQQFIQLLSNNTTPLPTSRWKTADSNIKPQVSDLVSMGIFKNLKESIWEVSLEGYYRRTQNLLDYVSGADLQLNKTIETQLISGEGKAYGLELMVTKKKGELSGWASYTYARSFQLMKGDFPELQQISQGNWYPTNYDKPHSLNIMMNIQPNKHHSFSFTFAYQTGRPFTSPVGMYLLGGKKYPVYESRNNDRISDYHRLDFSWTINNPSLKDKRWQGSWIFTVYNLYGRQNAYSVFFKAVGYGLQANELSVFAAPIVSLTYNFKFL
jgi:hypothetical protein